jgi:hypothetical protein
MLQMLLAEHFKKKISFSDDPSVGKELFVYFSEIKMQLELMTCCRKRSDAEKILFASKFLFTNLVAGASSSPSISLPEAPATAQEIDPDELKRRTEFLRTQRDKVNGKT